MPYFADRPEKIKKQAEPIRRFLKVKGDTPEEEENRKSCVKSILRIVEEQEKNTYKKNPR